MKQMHLLYVNYTLIMGTDRPLGVKLSIPNNRSNLYSIKTSHHQQTIKRQIPCDSC